MWVYLTGLPGGLAADRLLGAKLAVLLGECGDCLRPRRHGLPLDDILLRWTDPNRHWHRVAQTKHQHDGRKSYSEKRSSP